MFFNREKGDSKIYLLNHKGVVANAQTHKQKEGKDLKKGEAEKHTDMHSSANESFSLPPWDLGT